MDDQAEAAEIIQDVSEYINKFGQGLPMTPYTIETIRAAAFCYLVTKYPNCRIALGEVTIEDNSLIISAHLVPELVEIMATLDKGGQ